LRAGLLENLTVIWAITVGLQHESGEPRNRFLVQRPTEARAKLVKTTLELIRKQLDTANKEMDAYTTEEESSDDASGEEATETED
jgi:hypothetical protein